MTTSHHIIEVEIVANDKPFLLNGHVETSDEEPKFSVFYCIKSPERTELELEIRFLATNPLVVLEIVINIATLYGFCLAQKLTRKTAKEAIKCYRKSKKENPDYSILDHTKATGYCLASKGGVMKDAATDALVDCLPFSFEDGEDED